MTEFLNASGFFCVALTLVVFAAASALQQKCKLPVLNPILLSTIAIIAILNLLDIPNETYQAGCQALTFLMTPATLCLAISFYDQFNDLRTHLVAVTVGVLAGTVASLGSIWLLSGLFGLDATMTASLLPKSVTTAIGMALSEEIGGIGAITTAGIVITGIFGNMAGPRLCRVFRLEDPIAEGVAFGTAAHVIGTARAAEMSKMAGAVSSLSLTLAGLITCVIMSFAAQFL